MVTIKDKGEIKQRERTLNTSDGMYRRQVREGNKLLQSYDKTLLVKWLPDKERFSVWTRDRKGCAYLLYVAVDKDTGGYRAIGEKDKKFIAAMDMARKQKCYSLLKEVEEKNKLNEEKQKKKLSDAVMDISYERWRSVMGHPVVPCGIEF